MASWKKPPEVPQTAEQSGGETASETGFVFDLGNWGMEGWSQVTVAGIGIPVEAIVLPLPVIGLYLVFRSLYLFRARRVRTGKDQNPLPEMPVKAASACGQ